jgi:hypothetical protein
MKPATKLNMVKTVSTVRRIVDIAVAIPTVTKNMVKIVVPVQLTAVLAVPIKNATLMKIVRPVRLIVGFVPIVEIQSVMVRKIMIPVQPTVLSSARKTKTVMTTTIAMERRLASQVSVPPEHP